jgi:hypothetical protein
LDEDHAKESEHQRKHHNVTMAEFYGYWLQHQDTNAIVLLWVGRLRQQYNVDAYVAIEQNRLRYLRVATPLWRSVGVKPDTPKVRDLESSETPECLEFDNKAQNTLHWGVFGVIRKVLKRRYRKWPFIRHLGICRPSYGQKKGRESNWQFDSQPLKVGNRPLPDLRIESATWYWKDLDEG